MLVNMPSFSLPFMSLCCAWRLCRCRHSPAAPGRPTSGSPMHLLGAPPPQHRQKSQKLLGHLPQRHRLPPLQLQGLVGTPSASLPARPPCRAIRTRNWRSTRRHSTSLQSVPSPLPWLWQTYPALVSPICEISVLAMSRGTSISSPTGIGTYACSNTRFTSIMLLLISILAHHWAPDGHLGLG